MAPVIPEVGDLWTESSLLWRSFGGRGQSWSQTSPLDMSVIQTVSLLDQDELVDLLAWDASIPTIYGDKFGSFCVRLHTALLAMAPLLEEAMLWETAFIPLDCHEMVSASLDFVRDFAVTAAINDTPSETILFDTGSSQRKIVLNPIPWGTVAVILPQNAFLVVALTCLLNALYTGNRVILRAPLQSARSAALLGMAIAQAQPPPGVASVVLSRAKEFVEALCASDAPCLIHYMGSSAHAASILSQAFQGGKGAIVDGQGNGWVYVAEDADVEYAVEVLTRGALRYNGQTCTSINGAMIAPSIYTAIRERLQNAWDPTPCGQPFHL